MSFLSARKPPTGEWEILVHTDFSNDNYTNENAFGNPGTQTFGSATPSSTGAQNRTDYGDGVGVYNAFFEKTNISRFAFTDGTGSSLDPTTASRYAIYEPDYSNGRETTGGESIYDILFRIGNALQNNNYLGQSSHHNENGDTQVLNNSPGMTEIVGGSSGYSAVLVDSGGGGFDNNPHRDNFCVWGENFDSDHDIQTLCIYDNTLEDGNGKGDSWRGNGSQPSDSAWSFWGNDFYTNSTDENILNSSQTDAGLVNNVTDDVYLLGFAAPE